MVIFSKFRKMQLGFIGLLFWLVSLSYVFAASNKCLSKPFGYKAQHPTQKDAYFICLGKIGELEQNCAESFQFDESKQRCVKIRTQLQTNQLDVHTNSNKCNCCQQQVVYVPIGLPLIPLSSCACTCNKQIVTETPECTTPTSEPTTPEPTTPEPTTPAPEPTTPTPEPTTPTTEPTTTTLEPTTPAPEPTTPTTVPTTPTPEPTTPTTEPTTPEPTTPTSEPTTPTPEPTTTTPEPTTPKTEPTTTTLEPTTPAPEPTTPTPEPTTTTPEPTTPAPEPTTPKPEPTTPTTEPTTTKLEPTTPTTEPTTPTPEPTTPTTVPTTPTPEPTTPTACTTTPPPCHIITKPTTTPCPITMLPTSPSRCVSITTTKCRTTTPTCTTPPPKSGCNESAQNLEYETSLSANYQHSRPSIAAMLSGKCISIPPDCTQYYDGTFVRDNAYCYKYYICVNGQAITRTCPRGLYFDDIIMACNYAPLVHCVNCNSSKKRNV